MMGNLGASVPDQAGRASHGASIFVESPPSGDHPSRELLVKVLAYYEGRDPYDFHRLPADQRENEAHDAWQELAAEIRSHLRAS